jgi:hypothetical protein
MTKTIVIDKDLHVDVSPDGTAIVKNITDLGGINWRRRNE